MCATAAVIAEQGTGAGVLSRPSPRVRNHWIVLDAAWAERLGVSKEAGRYRIRSHELVRRLETLQEVSEFQAQNATEGDIGVEGLAAALDPAPGAMPIYHSSLTCMTPLVTGESWEKAASERSMTLPSA